MQGRQLASITTGGNTYSYSYDLDGIRTQKIVDGVTHTYITQNGKVVRESYGNTVMDFIYDNAGNPFALRYSTNGGSSYATYYYVLNLQGDVAKLVRIYAGTTIQEYEEMASYTYNAWGEIVASSGSMANINPLRYRGYYYDTETGFYYLQSRYYDPANHRFINADCYASTGTGFLGYNMFAYCNNNPVSSTDSSGYAPWMITASVKEDNPKYGSGTQYIDDQTRTYYSDWSLGQSTISDRGCGPIAVYNILKSRGSRATFRDVYEATFLFEALAEDGKEGVYFDPMLNVLVYLDPTCAAARDLNTSNAQSLFILYGFYDQLHERQGGHYVAAISVGNGKYVFYNDPFIANEPMSYDNYVNQLSQLRLTTDGVDQLYISIDLVGCCG